MVSNEYHEKIDLSWQSTESHENNSKVIKDLDIKMTRKRKFSIIRIIYHYTVVKSQSSDSTS